MQWLYYTLLLRFVSPSMTIRAGACAGGAAVGSDDAWRFSTAVAATKITLPSVMLPARASQKYMKTMTACVVCVRAGLSHVA